MAPPKKTSAAAPGHVASAAKVKDQADQLYYKCLEQKREGEDFTVRNFTTEELLSFDVAQNDAELLELGQTLVNRFKFVLLTHHGGYLYRCRSNEIAFALVKASVEAVMCYQQIESAGNSGCWKRILMMRTNLHENTVGKAIKELLKAKIIKEIKSAKYPTRRIYMLEYLKPSEENEGGSFYTDGELDQGLIETIGVYVVSELDKIAWAEQAGHPKTSKTRVQKHHGLKRKRGEERTSTTVVSETAATEVDDAALVNVPTFRIPENRATGNALIPLSPDHRHYPDAEQLARILNDAGILVRKKLSREDVQQLLHKLENDGLVERVRESGDGHKLKLEYRSVRKSWDRKTGTQDWRGPVEPGLDGIGPGNGLTQSPCGRCPVFKQCRPGGSVSPETCVYMDDWLKF